MNRRAFISAAAAVIPAATLSGAPAAAETLSALVAAFNATRLEIIALVDKGAEIYEANGSRDMEPVTLRDIGAAGRYGTTGLSESWYLPASVSAFFQAHRDHYERQAQMFAMVRNDARIARAHEDEAAALSLLAERQAAQVAFEERIGLADIERRIAALNKPVDEYEAAILGYKSAALADVKAKADFIRENETYLAVHHDPARFLAAVALTA